MRTITLLLFAIMSIFKTAAQVDAFRYTIEDKGDPFHIGEIDILGINNNPNKIGIVRKVKTIVEGDIKRFPNKVSNGYNISSGRHQVLYENVNVPMQTNTHFNILFVDRDTEDSQKGNFTHVALPDTFNENIAFASVFDNPLTNDDPTWRFLVSSFFGIGEVTNEELVFVYFNLFGTGEWVLQTLIGINFPVNSEHNVVGETSEIFRYKHTSTTENIGRVLNSATQFSFFTVLDDPFINNNPNALVFIETVVPTGSSNAEFPFEHSVYYNEDTGFWELHIELETFPGSDFNFPINKCFNIFATEETLSTASFNKEEVVKLYPNPVDAIFNIEIQQSILEVLIYNSIGQHIDTLKGNGAKHLEVDMQKYASGNYVVKIVSKDGTETQKVIKN